MIKKYHLEKKYFVMFVSLFFLGIFLLIMGISYAYFTTSAKGKEFVIYTGNLAVNYEKKTNVIGLDNAYPMTDEEGLNTVSHEFTISNTGNIDARYQIRLELDDSIKEMVPIEYIKVSYSKDNGEYSVPVSLGNLNSSLVFVSNEIISSNQVDTYGIKLWIDLSAPNDIQGKTFKAKVVVDSIQNVEDGYVVDTAPIIYLNKDSSGNQDIHLKTNQNYTELGVERVEDDQEVFTPSQVALSYEYYDGSNLTNVASIDTSKNGIYYVNYSVTDKSGNVGQRTRVVTVNNTDIIPSISLNGEANISLGENDFYKENGVSVENDNQVVIIGEVKTSTLGTYVIRYIVVDTNGNLNSVIRTITVNQSYTESILNGTDPVLTSNLVPVVIAEDGTVTKASTASSWYSYENKIWANAVVLKDESISYVDGDTIPEDNIESYFVWIPKYSYQIWDLGDYSSRTSIEAKEQTINVKFGLNNTSDSNTGECATVGVAGESGNCKVGDYMTHPAFLAFNTNGIWVGKFETGYDGATSVATAQVSSSDSSKIIIKPNVYSWRSNTIGNMFEASYQYLRSDESHMMKNTEWGAVAYLQHSMYGSATSVRINNNSNFITGYAAIEEPTLGYSSTSIEGNRYEGTNPEVDGTYTVNYLNSLSNVASTTGNKSGIYDMSGGAWDYVMGYTTGATTVGGSSGITTLHSDFFTSSSWSKYYDKYTSTANINYNNRILGDATGEMGPFASQVDPDSTTRNKSSWYGDYAHFANSVHPWFAFGGRCYDGMSSGAFALGVNTGGASTYISFRVVLAP